MPRPQITVCTGATLRSLVATDIAAALELSAQAGWNQTAVDWQMLIELAPEGCLAIEVDGELAATTTLLCYGRRLGWVGMVLTKASYRGRGFARSLLKQAITLADEMQIETVKLDATSQGRPLYEKMGFRVEQPVERWSRPGLADASRIVVPEIPLTDRQIKDRQIKDHWQSEDTRSFGADRGEVLDRLAQRNPPLSTEGSYLLTRPGRETEYLGPGVCNGPETARALIERALQSAGSRGWSWDLLPRNENALAIARGLEFTPTRYLHRMVRGKDLHSDEKAIYAIAGFELG